MRDGRQFRCEKLPGRSGPEALRPAAGRTGFAPGLEILPSHQLSRLQGEPSSRNRGLRARQVVEAGHGAAHGRAEAEGYIGAATFWVENAASLAEGKSDAPDAARFRKQVARMAMFDSLIGNGARNLGNTLRDPVWNLILLDHSRAFGAGDEPLADLSRIDKELWGRIEALTRPQLDAALSPWLEQYQIRAIEERRENEGRDRPAAVTCFRPAP